ncbi:unnamed protein product [Parnassius apollo]|uniref:(apollo) hypothetical protein n=1 Tax=Parnassius apollo TaxID=110799 RepID=A0A8S3X4M7_PARAO|nr:unnamed protein product [Parnassius apollo]
MRRILCMFKRLSVPTSGSARRRARERRRAKQTRIEGERLARERRELRLKEKIEQQRKARKELASYEPWGRAGGGAPNPHGIRFTDLRSRGIYPEDELKGISTHEVLHRWSTPKRRQTRKPLRLREDPQLIFAEQLRRAVDNNIRYKQIKDQQKIYKDVLDDMVVKKKKAIKDEMKQNLEYEHKMGWTNNEIFNKLKGEHCNYMRSSLTLPKVKRDDDLIDQSLFDKENTKSSSVEKLPEITKQISPNISGRDKVKISEGDHALRKSNDTNVKNGKSKKSPRKTQFVKRLCNGERVTKIKIDDQGINTSSNNIIDTKPTPEGTILRLTGGIELVPLLARRRRIGACTLHSSDVTRPPEQSCQWRDMLDVDYLRHLKHQMQVKCEQKEESRLASAESERMHHATWSSLWGRPGHGAPQLRGRYARNNLAQLLYFPVLTNT